MHKYKCMHFKREYVWAAQIATTVKEGLREEKSATPEKKSWNYNTGRMTMSCFTNHPHIILHFVPCAELLLYMF